MLTAPLAPGQEKQAPPATAQPPDPALDKKEAEKKRKEFEEGLRRKFGDLMKRAADEAGAVDEAIELARQHGNDFTGRWFLVVHSWIADKQLLRGDAVAALESANKAVEHKDGPEAMSQWIYAIATRAEAYSHLGLLDKAHADVLKAVSKLNDLEKQHADQPQGKRPYGPNLVFKVQLCEADILSSREDHKGMQRRVNASLKHPLHTSGVDKGVVAARLRGRLGMSFSEQSRLDESFVELAREQFELARSCEALDASTRAQFLLGLAELEWRQNNEPRSIELLNAAEKEIEGRSDPSTHPMFRTLRALKARQLFEGRLKPATDEALQKEREKLEDAIRAATEEFANRKLRPGGYGLLQYADLRGMLFELMRYEMHLDPSEAGRGRALDHLLAIGEATTLGRRLGAQAASVASVRAELIRDDPKHGVLAYLPSAAETHVFLVTKDQVVHQGTSMADVVEKARVEALGKLRCPLDPAATPEDRDGRVKALRELSSMLFPSDIRKQLTDCSRVTILGRDLLGEAPFEVLELEAGKELGLTHAVTHAPSASVAIVLARRARAETPRKASESGAFALIALPEDAKLKTKQDDLAPILEAYPKEGRSGLFGDEFDHGGMEVAMSKSSVSQVFTHGMRDGSRERSTVFVARNSLVGADELERLNASQLTILTLCGGGISLRRRGDGGAADLAGACFSGGERSRCVIQCAVDLEALAAVEITTHLARGLREGLDVAEAMRQARIAMSKSKHYSDPFHRMLYVVGAGHAPVFRR